MRIAICTLLATSCLCLGLHLSCQGQNPRDAAEADYSAELPRIAPLSAEQARGSFEIQPGFRIELVAAEPLVKDPVAFAFNGAGHLFVVEMCDYSEQETEHLGSVARLVDTNQDGVMDARTTFAENLSWPTAIWPWKDGVIVAEPPNLLWLRDTNGDGVSDQRQLWYAGFGRSNVQGLVNSLRWTVDGMIQGATSSSGAELKRGSADANAATEIALRGRDFVIDPLTQQIQPASGGGQHGMCFNRWGDKFATSNSDHLQQIINLDGWLGQHTVAVPIPAMRRSIAIDGPQAEVFRASPVEPWRIVRTRLRVSGAVPGIVEGGGRAAGYFTGATGTWVMDREAGFGDTDFDTALVCDVGSNLVHRKRLKPQGLFWSGERIDAQAELLRSSDIWFRPVQLGDGPDGALYIADMYREVIEHPKSLPPVIKRHLDLTSGRDRGRIWRVTPTAQTNVTSARTTTFPDRLNASELVSRLHHPVAWQRRMASQLLIERGETAAVAALQQAATSGPLPEGRLLALHILNRWKQLNDATLKQALQDSHPRVLEHAVRLASTPAHAAACSVELQQVPADDPHVQLALAMMAENLPDGARLTVLRKLMATTEPLTRAIIVVAAGFNSPELLAAANEPTTQAKDWLPLLLPAWNQLLRTAAAEPAKQLRDSLQGLLNQQLLAPATAKANWLNAICALPNRAAADQLLAVLSEADRNRLTTSVRTDVESSIHAIQADPKAGQAVAAQLTWMRLLPAETLSDLAEDYLTPTAVESIQIPLADALLWNDPDKAVSLLIPALPRMTPSLKRQVLTSMLRYSQSLGRIADAIDSQKIAKAEIAPDVRQQLFSLPNKPQAERFKKLLSTASADRAQVIDKYRGQLATASPSATTQVAQGRQTFQRVCAQCHRVQDMGNDVGPPLKQLADKSPEQLLETILDPNREVDPKFLGYSVLMNDGRVLAGIIREESAGQIVLAETGGKQHTIARSDIDQLKTTGLSLMPIGLEEQITPQQMSELVAFLKAAGVQ